MKKRKLTKNEIITLETQGCHADDWSLVEVSERFTPSHFSNVFMSGPVSLGVYNSTIDLGNGDIRLCGIHNTTLRNCTIADNVYISDVRNLINYDIEENVVLENVGRIQVEGESTFGNGIDIEVLNANGNRRFPMFDLLSAQLAYLMTTYRQNPELNKKLENIITAYVATKKSSRGVIGKNARISDSGKIINVRIGPYTRISGARALEEGTIISNQLAPVAIGDAVIAREFIILSGSKMDSGAILEKSFVGQAVQVGKQFSADNSLLFCNSEFFHGEACNIFAGPFTVSHHKSTLLIAAMFSFFNAGSGSNQSNHMYKLGPIHQGVVERGSKTGSFSYLLWPSRIGAFSVIIGKHMTNFDAADFPFSYIIETDNKTVILPALNYFNAGTERDKTKWQQRDHRTDREIYDLINFELLTPFIAHKIVKAIDILKELEQDLSGDEKHVHFKGMMIEKHRITKAINDYESILQIYLGDTLLKQLGKLGKNFNDNDIAALFYGCEQSEHHQWVDAAGMIVPVNLIRPLYNELGKPGLNSIEQIYERFKKIHADFDDYSWSWCKNLIYKLFDLNVSETLIPTLKTIISDWQAASEKALRRTLKDAAKEFVPKSRIGYGINGNEDMRDREFAAIVGTYAENPFIITLNKKLAGIEERAEKTISVLEMLHKEHVK